MAAPKGIAAIEWLAKRTKEQRGGNEAQPDYFDRSTPGALAPDRVWIIAVMHSK
jgi:hypothetical protein